MEQLANNAIVRPLRCPYTPPLCAETQHELASPPRDRLRIGHRDLLHICAKIPRRSWNRGHTCGTLVLAFRFWHGNSVIG